MDSLQQLVQKTMMFENWRTLASQDNEPSLSDLRLEIDNGFEVLLAEIQSSGTAIKCELLCGNASQKVFPPF